MKGQKETAITDSIWICIMNFLCECEAGGLGSWGAENVK